MKNLLLVAALLCGTAHAQFKTGNKLLGEMLGSYGEQMNALGYVTGVADTLDNSVVCIPNTVNAGQLSDMTKLYLETYPQTRHMAADALIHRVLIKVWPCVKGSGT